MIRAQRTIFQTVQQSLRKTTRVNTLSTANTLKSTDKKPAAAASESSGTTDWANIIPMKDPEVYKKMVKKYNEKRE